MFLKSDKKFPYTCISTAYRTQFIHFFAFLYIVSSLRMKLDSKWRWFYHPSSPLHSVGLYEKLNEKSPMFVLVFMDNRNNNLQLLQRG